MSNLPIGIPTGEPANEEQWNAGYLAGFDDGKCAAMVERDRLRDALIAASNYIDNLGGVSQSYRQVIARTIFAAAAAKEPK